MKPWTLAAMAVAGVLAFQGAHAYKTLQDKARAQEDSTEAIQRWKASYLALAGSQRQWQEQYPTSESVVDLYSLLQLADLQRYGLSFDRDAVALTRIEPVTGNGANLGLSRYCLSSQGTRESGALRVQADSYGALLTGLRQLAVQPQFYIGSVAINGEQDLPGAELGHFCLQLRQEAHA